MQSKAYVKCLDNNHSHWFKSLQISKVKYPENTKTNKLDRFKPSKSSKEVVSMVVKY